MTRGGGQVSDAAEDSETEASIPQARFARRFLKKRNHYACTLTPASVVQCRETFGIPLGYKVRLPYPGETPSSTAPGEVCFLTDHFRYSLRLPLPEFFVAFLNDSGFVPAMIAPNSLALVLAAHELFRRAGIPWTTSSFFHLYRVNDDAGCVSFKTRHVNFSLTGLSTSNSGWRSRYVLVSHPDVWPFNILPTDVSEDTFEVPAGLVSPQLREYLRTTRKLDARAFLQPFLHLSGAVMKIYSDFNAGVSIARLPHGAVDLTGGASEEVQEEEEMEVRGEPETPAEDRDIPAAESEAPVEEPSRKRRRLRASRGKAKVPEGGEVAGAVRSPRPHPSSPEGLREQDPLRAAGETGSGQYAGPISWSSDRSVACVRQRHQQATESMGGKLSTFPIEAAELLRSEADRRVRSAWPRDQRVPRVMQHSLDAFLSTYFLAKKLEGQQARVMKAEGVIEDLEKGAVLDKATLDGLATRVNEGEKALGEAKKAEATAQLERDEARKELAEMKVECYRAFELGRQSVFPVDVRIFRGRLRDTKLKVKTLNDSVDADRDVIVSLQAAKGALEERVVGLEAENEALKGRASSSLPVAVDDPLREEVELLRKQLADPLVLRDLYSVTEPYEEDMTFYGGEGFNAARNVVSELISNSPADTSLSALLEKVEELDFDKVMKGLSDAAAARAGSGEEGQSSSKAL